MQYEVREPTAEEAKSFYSALALPLTEARFGLFIDGTLQALAGVLTDPPYIGSPLEDDARRIVFFDIHEEAPLHVGLDITRRIRDWLKARKQTVFAQRDDRHPQSEKFLRALGFRPTAQLRRDLQNSSRMLRMWVRPADL